MPCTTSTLPGRIPKTGNLCYPDKVHIAASEHPRPESINAVVAATVTIHHCCSQQALQAATHIADDMCDACSETVVLVDLP